MSRYYRELHDRELLAQAESILMELGRRRLIDVAVPCKDRQGVGESTIRCTPVSVTKADQRLTLNLDRRFTLNEDI